MPVRPYFGIFTPANPDIVGFASNVTGAVWTLSNTVIPDELGHKVSIKNDTANSHVDKTALLTGTDQDGKVQSETVILPGPSLTVESLLYFKTLISIVPSATIGADTMDIGWTNSFVSKILPYNWHGAHALLQFDKLNANNIDYTWQYTTSDIQRDPKPFIWNDSNDSNLVNATLSSSGAYIASPMAGRLKMNSYSNGASIRVAIIQSDQVV